MANLFSFLFKLYYKRASIASVYAFLGATPTWRPTTSPFWKTKTVGMLRTPYFAANSWFASTSTLPTIALPSYSSLICSMIGPTILHGPHQAAQKSTNTGLLLFNTVSSNVASVISNAIIFIFYVFNLILSYKFTQNNL